MENLSFKYRDKLLEVNLIYRKRKTISIRIIPKDKIEVIAPKRTTKKYIRELLDKKSEWIVKNLDKFSKIDDSIYDRNYEDGDIYYYNGKAHKLLIIKDKNISNKKSYSYIDLEGDNIKIRTNNWDSEYIKEALKKWYKLRSEEVIMSRIEYLRKSSELFRKINPSLVKVKEQKRIWGSCNSKKTIYINSKISMLPEFAVDYIIVHEFCHILHMNHSKEFYNTVEKIIPNHREIANWLKENNSKFVL